MTITIVPEGLLLMSFTQSTSVGFVVCDRRRHDFAVSQPTKPGARRIGPDGVHRRRVAQYRQPVANGGRRVVRPAGQQPSHCGRRLAGHLSALVFVARPGRRGRPGARPARHVWPGTVTPPAPHSRPTAA